MSKRLYLLQRDKAQGTLEDTGAFGRDAAVLGSLHYLEKVLPWWRDNHEGNSGADWCPVPPEQMDRMHRGNLAYLGLRYTGAGNGDGRLTYHGWTYYVARSGRYRRYRAKSGEMR